MLLYATTSARGAMRIVSVTTTLLVIAEAGRKMITIALRLTVT